MTTVPRRAKTPPAKTKKFNPAGIAKAFAQFRELKGIEAKAKVGAEELRTEQLLPALVEHGVAHGEKGQHLAIDLPEPIDGYVRLVRRSNVSTWLNIDRAEALLKKKNALPEAQVVTVTITGVPATRLLEVEAALAKGKWEGIGVLPNIDVSFNQDALMALYQRHRQELQELEDSGKRISARERARYLTEADIDGLMDSDTTYSFHPEKL